MDNKMEKLAKIDKSKKEASLSLELVRSMGSGSDGKVWSVPLNLHVTQTLDDDKRLQISEESSRSKKRDGSSIREMSERLPLNLVVKLEQKDSPPINVTDITLDKQSLKIGAPKEKPPKKRKSILAGCINPRLSKDSNSSIDTVENALSLDLKFVVDSPVTAIEKAPAIVIDDVPSQENISTCPALRPSCKASCTADCAKTTAIQSAQEDIKCPGKKNPCPIHCNAPCFQQSLQEDIKSPVKKSPCPIHCKTLCSEQYENINHTLEPIAQIKQAQNASDEDDYFSSEDLRIFSEKSRPEDNVPIDLFPPLKMNVPEISEIMTIEKKLSGTTAEQEARLLQIVTEHAKKMYSKEDGDTWFRGISFPFMDRLKGVKQSHQEEIENQGEITAAEKNEENCATFSQEEDPPLIIDIDVIGQEGNNPNDVQWFVQYCEEEMQDLDQKTEKMRNQLTEPQITALNKLEKESKGATTFDGVVDENVTKIQWHVDRQIEITIVGKDIQVEMKKT